MSGLDWAMAGTHQMEDPETMRRMMAAAVSQKGRSVPGHLLPGGDARRLERDRQLVERQPGRHAHVTDIAHGYLTYE